MKKIFFTFIIMATMMQTAYSQPLHKQKHKKTRTAFKMCSNDTCRSNQPHAIFQPSNEVNNKVGNGFPSGSLFICPIADDIYRSILSGALKGIQITY